MSFPQTHANSYITVTFLLPLEKSGKSAVLIVLRAKTDIYKKKDITSQKKYCIVT